jgi:hypothetical protein
LNIDRRVSSTTKAAMELDARLDAAVAGRAAHLDLERCSCVEDDIQEVYLW